MNANIDKTLTDILAHTPKDNQPMIKKLLVELNTEYQLLLRENADLALKRKYDSMVMQLVSQLAGSMVVRDISTGTADQIIEEAVMIANKVITKLDSVKIIVEK